MILETLRNFAQQLTYVPHVEHDDVPLRSDRAIIVGMGGSHLGAGLITRALPHRLIRIHQNYGLPNLPPEELKRHVVILSSYSGNTEEVLESFKEARSHELATAALAAGGILLEKARGAQIPFIKFPDARLEPRMALGYSIIGLLKLLHEDREITKIHGLGKSWKPAPLEKEGKELGERLRGCVPIVYASSQNHALAYNWKIRFNESAKIPSFYNTFPELNHNELAGFDIRATTQGLSDHFAFVFLYDDTDHPRIIRRMEFTETIYREKGFRVERVMLNQALAWEKIFTSLQLADWAAYSLATYYATEPEKTPLIKHLKSLMH